MPFLTINNQFRKYRIHEHLVAPLTVSKGVVMMLLIQL
jgi:hypothetical protein